LDCSCPDFAVPCKHVAAACYLLAESFDDDPFGILAWRGRERDELLANVAAARDAGAPAADRAERARPLADCLAAFFVRGDAPRPAPAQPAGELLDQLPDIALLISGRSLPELLGPAYQALGGDTTETALAHRAD
jgi:uncharacterized Zn finger protein